MKQFKNASKMAKKLSGKNGMRQMQDIMAQMQGAKFPR
jgi:signal recognition particle subunit SRP54